MRKLVPYSDIGRYVTCTRIQSASKHNVTRKKLFD